MGWISVKDSLPEYNHEPRSLGVEVEVKGVDLPKDFAFYGVRQTDKPNFYIYGRVLSGVTHWKYKR